MEFRITESRLSQLSARLNLMVVLVLGLMLSNIILSYLALHALTHQKREVVPFGANNGYVISDTSVDEHYLNLMAQNFVYSRLNVTPQNISHNHEMLLGYVDSSIYPEFNKTLFQEEEVIKNKKIASSFDIINVQSDPEQLISLVQGNLKRYVGYRALKEEEKNYRIQYRYRQGKLSIVSFAEVKGEHDA